MAPEEYIPAPAQSQRTQPALSVAIPDALSAAGPYCLRRPRLHEILANTSPSPWTLTAFMAYLSSNHCLETLEFIMDAARYRKHYTKMLSRAVNSDLPPAKDREYVHGLWDRLIEAYIAPNGSRAVNLPYEVRNPVMQLKKDVLPPSPATLDLSISKTYELMEESVLSPFLNSFCPQSALPGTSSIQHRLTDESVADDDNVSVATSTMSFDHQHRTLFGSRRNRQSVRSQPPAGSYASTTTHRPSCPADHTISPPLSPRSSQQITHPLNLRKAATATVRGSSPSANRTSLSHTLSSPAALLRRDPNGTRANRPQSTIIHNTAPLSSQTTRTDSSTSIPVTNGTISSNLMPPNISPPLQTPQSQQTTTPSNIKRDSFFHFGSASGASSQKPDSDPSKQHLPLPQQIISSTSDPSLDNPTKTPTVDHYPRPSHRHQASLTSISMPAIPLPSDSQSEVRGLSGTGETRTGSSGGSGGVWQKLGNKLAGRMKSTRVKSGSGGGRNFSTATTGSAMGRVEGRAEGERVYEDV